MVVPWCSRRTRRSARVMRSAMFMASDSRCVLFAAHAEERCALLGRQRPVVERVQVSLRDEVATDGSLVRLLAWLADVAFARLVPETQNARPREGAWCVLDDGCT